MQGHAATRVLQGIAMLVTLWALAAVACNAQGEQIPWSVVAMGGVIGATDGDNIFSATLGQPIIGPATNGEDQIFQGFWVPKSPTITSVDIGARLTGAFGLRNYPNPFSTTTTIQYRLDEQSRVTLSVVDLLGNPVITLLEQTMDAGEHAAEWNGTTGTGSRAGGGVYLYVLTVQPTGSDASSVRSERRKLVLVR